MRHLVFVLIFSVTVISHTSAQPSQQQTPRFTPAAEITFTFTRQTGSASNQYAVWIENAQGQLIKTLYATRWTAAGGYRSRPASIPVWVRQSGLAGMTSSQVDAVSGATPRTGAVTYTWDGTDSRGALVPSGDYTLVLEGTLRWENQVLCRALFRLGQLTSGQNAASPQVHIEYTGDSTAERSMIADVRVRVLR